MTAISVERVTKRFDQHVAVDGISFAVARGAVYGLLGPNGAGKTTTIRMILDIIRPDEGKITILGGAPGSAITDRIGYLPEERGLYPKMKTGEHLAFLAEIKGVPRREAASAIASWMERLGIASWKDRKVDELSKGMQQKLQFIGTIIHRPEVLILDEPFSGLDPVNTDLFKDTILDLNRQGTTVIFSTHVMEQVEKMCQGICLINRSKVVAEGPLSDVKKRYGANTVVLGFSGDGSFLRSLPGVAKANLHPNFAELRMSDGQDPSGILAAAMARVSVRRFEIVEPTLHSIFVDLVGGESSLPPPAPASAPAAGAVHV
jgi:ABC-2 type transport system ATP-binding protein